MLKRKLAKLLLNIFDRLVAIFSDNRSLPHSEYLEGFRFLEQHTDIIREEFLAVQENHISPVSKIFVEQQKIADERSWMSFMLRVFGYEIEQHTQCCPYTAELIRHKRISSAMFSVLKSGKQISPHKGIYKGVIRGHLGLIIPEGDCRMILNKESVSWNEGKMIFIDDTYEHAVHNNTDKDRVILFIDIIRPLPFPLNLINMAIFYGMAKSVFIQNILSEIRKEHEINVKSVSLRF